MAHLLRHGLQQLASAAAAAAGEAAARLDARLRRASSDAGAAVPWDRVDVAFE